MTLDIGSRLKAVREERGLSQRELASRAGMTSGAVSLMEQNKTSPSVSSLKRLLDAIPMPLSEFFSELEQTNAPKHFYTADEFTELSPQDLGLGVRAGRVSLRQLGDAARHAIQMLHETYPPGADTGPEPLSHEAEEAGVVMRGIIEVHVGDDVRVLNPGDGYIFDSRLPHRFRNIGSEDCVLISACTPPTF
ncbi:cupin domain-containing protein [Puniceibacterium sp. IMCC21224]|uniref:cupin domain-containing protein n=1 Tax=Puniceibacterium sp. IMCC21224 TaxID=1618204 RepID=UPI00064DB73E|nr:cupin domain-containing protein [Puniceibacterium sp. IMCC21224]KMK66324.1 transcriptional regulator, XRE family with cupin sensor [Puniceibacterium sp. IMCC21224]